MDVESITSKETHRQITQATIEEQLRKTKQPLHTVTADAELFKELHVKPNRFVELNPVGISEVQLNEKRRQRVGKWIDNDSV